PIPSVYQISKPGKILDQKTIPRHHKWQRSRHKECRLHNARSSRALLHAYKVQKRKYRRGKSAHTEDAKTSVPPDPSLDVPVRALQQAKVPINPLLWLRRSRSEFRARQCPSRVFLCIIGRPDKPETAR